jgi:hypothetical protein
VSTKIGEVADWISNVADWIRNATGGSGVVNHPADWSSSTTVERTSP